MDPIIIMDWLKQPSDYIKFWIARATEIAFGELPTLAKDLANAYEAESPAFPLDRSVNDYFVELHELKRSGLINITLNRENIAWGYGFFIGGRGSSPLAPVARESSAVPAASPVETILPPKPLELVRPDPALNLLNYVVRYNGVDYQIPRTGLPEPKTLSLDNGIEFFEDAPFNYANGKRLFRRILYARIWDQGNYEWKIKDSLFEPHYIGIRDWIFDNLEGLHQPARYVLLKDGGEPLAFEIFPPLLIQRNADGGFQFRHDQPLKAPEADSLDALNKLAEDKEMMAYGTDSIRDFAVHILGQAILPPHFIVWSEDGRSADYFQPHRPLPFYGYSDTVVGRDGRKHTYQMHVSSEVLFGPYFIVLEARPKMFREHGGENNGNGVAGESFVAYLLPNLSHKEMFLNGIAELERMRAIGHTRAEEIRSMTYTYDEFVAEARNPGASRGSGGTSGTPSATPQSGTPPAPASSGGRTASAASSGPFDWMTAMTRLPRYISTAIAGAVSYVSSLVEYSYEPITAAADYEITAVNDWGADVYGEEAEETAYFGDQEIDANDFTVGGLPAAGAVEVAVPLL